MYTLIRDGDGSLDLRIHGSTSDLSPEQARRILVGLSPVLARLRRRGFELPPRADHPSGRSSAAAVEGRETSGAGA